MTPKKIAIVGAGISGLTAAHLLSAQHDVTVFEAEDRAGGHAHTIEVDGLGIDTGFVVLNDRNYPGFTKLLDRLGVRTQVSDMSMSVASDDGRVEYASTSVNGLFANRRALVDRGFWRMIGDVRRFQREAPELLRPDADPEISLGDYLEANGYSRGFIDHLLVPQASAVWSADPQQMWEFPARFLVRFFHNHGMLALRDRPTWHTVTGGSRSYVRRVVEPLRDRLHLGAPVVQVTRDEQGVLVTPAGHEPLRFDEVVLALHAPQALKVLGDGATDDERRILGAFPYSENETVLHTDETLLPRRRAAWASWNYHLLPEPTGRTVITYHMNRLQALAPGREYCVTLNRTERIDPAKILATMTYHHPIFTPAGMAAQEDHGVISGQHHTHYAGAYWRWGFHEDGVFSGARVAEALGAGW